MESVLPSEIARLVYGYLEAEGCSEAAHSFLETSPHLQECLKVAQEGRRFSTRIHGRTLVQTLDLFFNINSIIQERAEKLNNTAVNNTALSLSVSNNSLVEQLFNLLEGTNTSAINRSSNNNTNTVLLSITVPSQDDTIRVRQHSSGKRRMSVDGDLSKNKEKVSQSSSNVETLKLRKDHNTEDDPVIDLSCGEELLTRLLDNTQLHEKIAENINKAIYTPEKMAPDNGKDVIQTILKQTEADPLFEQLISELVGPAEEDSTPEDTEFEDGHQRNGDGERKNEDGAINIKQRLRSAKSKDRSARDVLEEQNASAVQSILDSCRIKHRKQTDSEQLNTDRNESDKENENKMNANKNETNCSNLLQTAMMNCDINSSPLGTSSERSKSKVDGQLSSGSDHQQTMDLCFIDVNQMSPEPSHQTMEESSQEKASSMMLIQSDNLATTPLTSCTSGSQIIIPPSLCPNVVTLQPGYTNVLTVLAPGVSSAAPNLATSTPTVQNKNVPTVLLYEDFLRMQSTHSPIEPMDHNQGSSTLLQTPTSIKQYKPIAPKPAGTSESTIVPACSGSVTTNTSVSGTSEVAMDTNETELQNATVVPIVCATVHSAQIPSTSGPVRSGKGWRKGLKGVKKKLLRRSPKLRKILPRRPPVRNFINVKEQKLVNGVEVKVLDYDATGEEALPVIKKGEPVEIEGPHIEVISEEKIQVEMNVIDDDKNGNNVGIVEASKDNDSEKPVANTGDLAASDINKSNSDTPEVTQSKKGLSLSTPRRKHSHVRALDFNTPAKGTLKRPNTSPKAANRWSPRKNFMRNAKRSALFKSPTSNKSKKKFGTGEIPKQQNLSKLSESEEQVSLCVKEEMHIPVNGTPKKEVHASEKSLLPPVATMSPATKLCGDWGQVNGVELILSSTGKDAVKKSWDADLRALAGGQFEDPSPPPKKQSSQKKNCERISNNRVSPNSKNEKSKLSCDNSKINKKELIKKKIVGKKNVETKVTAKQTQTQNKVKKLQTKANKNTKLDKPNVKDNKNTKKGRPRGRPPKKRNADDDKTEETDTEVKTFTSKEFISDTESSEVIEKKKESPSKTNEQNSDNENEKSASGESDALMVDDSQENLNKNSMSETEIAQQLEENLRQIVGDESSSEKADQNTVISTECIRKVLESSKENIETDKNDEENKVASNEDNDKDKKKESNDTTDHNISPANINSERSLSRSTLQHILTADALPVLETPIKLDFVGVVPKTPNLDTPMLKDIRENTSVLSADLLLTPFAQTPLQSSSVGTDQTPYKDISPRNSSNLEQVLIKECCRMEEEIVMKKSMEGKILEHNEKIVNSEEKLNKSQKTSVEVKNLIKSTSSIEMNKVVCVESLDKNISVVCKNEMVSIGNDNKNYLQQRSVTSPEKKREGSCEENKSSENMPESITETKAEESFGTPRKSKNNVNCARSKAKTRVLNRSKSNNRNKINSGEKSGIKMKIDSVESIRQELMRKARQEVYGESSISSCDFSIADIKKLKKQRKTKVYSIVYSDDSSVDMPDNKISTPVSRSNRKKKKSGIFESSDKSDVEAENVERECTRTPGIGSATTLVPVVSQEQNRLNKAVDQSISPEVINKVDELNASNSQDQSNLLCKEKSAECTTKADAQLSEQSKETSKDKNKNIKNVSSDSAEVNVQVKTIPHLPDSMKAIGESSQTSKKIINSEQSSPASDNLNTNTAEMEKPSSVANTKNDLEKQTENSSDFPPLQLSPEPEGDDDDDCHSELMLNIVEEDAVLSPAKKSSVLENDLELSSTEPEKRNFPINFVSEIKEYHLTEITFNESNDDDAAKRKSRDIRVVKNESYEEVYFDESKYTPKPKKIHNINNFQMNIFIDEDENGAQSYCKLSVQPLQNLFEMRPIEITESSLDSGNFNEKAFQSSDSIIVGKKFGRNVSEKQLEKPARASTPHPQQKYSKDMKHYGRSPSSTKSEYSISRSRISESHRNWRASSTKTMLVTRTVDGRKRIAPVRLDDYDYERRQRRRYEDNERRKSSDRQRGRDRDRDSERFRDRDSDRYRESERYRERDREYDRDRENERYRDRENERYRDRDFERYRDRARESDRGRDRDRELERDCCKESEKHRDGERGKYRDIYRERSGDRGRSRERDKNTDEDIEVRSSQSADFVRDRNHDRRRSDVEDQSDNKIKELNETSEAIQNRELINYDDKYSYKSSDTEEGQCSDVDVDDDDLMNQVVISNTLSPRKKDKENADHSIVGTPNKLPPKKRKASDDISVGPFKIARTEEPQALLKKVDLEKFLTAVHGDDASTSGHQPNINY